MEKKMRRYEISSKVRIPDMDDIQRAASNFNETRISDEQKNDFIARNAKHVVPANEEKYNPVLNNMKKEMQQLAFAVASEESENKESQNEEIEIKEQENSSAAAADEQPVELDENSVFSDVSRGDEVLLSASENTL